MLNLGWRIDFDDSTPVAVESHLHIIFLLPARCCCSSLLLWQGRSDKVVDWFFSLFSIKSADKAKRWGRRSRVDRRRKYFDPNFPMVHVARHTAQEKIELRSEMKKILSLKWGNRNNTTPHRSESVPSVSWEVEIYHLRRDDEAQIRFHLSQSPIAIAWVRVKVVWVRVREQVNKCHCGSVIIGIWSQFIRSWLGPQPEKDRDCDESSIFPFTVI